MDSLDTNRIAGTISFMEAVEVTLSVQTVVVYPHGKRTEKQVFPESFDSNRASYLEVTILNHSSLPMTDALTELMTDAEIAYVLCVMKTLNCNFEQAFYAILENKPPLKAICP